MLGQPVVRPATLSRCHPALHIRNPDEMVTHNEISENQNIKIHDKFDDLLRVHRKGSGQEDGLNCLLFIVYNTANLTRNILNVSSITLYSRSTSS